MPQDYRRRMKRWEKKKELEGFLYRLGFASLLVWLGISFLA